MDADPGLASSSFTDTTNIMASRMYSGCCWARGSDEDQVGSQGRYSCALPCSPSDGCGVPCAVDPPRLEPYLLLSFTDVAESSHVSVEDNDWGETGGFGHVSQVPSHHNTCLPSYSLLAHPVRASSQPSHPQRWLGQFSAGSAYWYVDNHHGQPCPHTAERW